MSIDVNVQNDLVIVTESSEDIVVNVSNAAGPQGPAGAAGVGVPVGGTTGQVLKKFTNTNYDTYWAADASGLTSVGLSMPSGFSVSNSPLTSNGTISVTGAGTTSQYLRGDGSLATFPSIPGGTVTSVNLTAGTGVSVSGGPITTSGSILVTNTAPDQVVSLTGGGTTTITGTYPNFTISSADSKLGTVTSVDMTVPTGLTISGNPITSAGTLAVGLASGYSIPTTASQANWNTAYNDSIVSAAVTGTTTKTLTLNQQDGGTVTASWSDLNTDAVTSVFGRTGAVVATEGDYTLTQLGDVTLTSPTNGQVLKYNGTTWVNNTDTDTGLTSVGISMPSAFSVSNSPLTSNGTIAVTGAGSASQYVRGDGTLAAFPSVGGGGGGTVYYLNGNISQGSIGGTTMYQLSVNAQSGISANFTRSTTGVIASFITDVNQPNQLTVPSGIWVFETYLSEAGGGAAHATVQAIVEKWNGTSITVIATGTAEEITNGNVKDLYQLGVSIPTGVTLLATDRIVIQIQIANTAGKTVTLYTENGNISSVSTTFASGLASLNGLTTTSQYFATGTSGTDFGISSSSNTHTFNLPTASASNRGLLSSADWTTFNNKQNALTNPVTGTGTTNYLPKWTSGSALGNSIITDSGSIVTVGGVLTVSTANINLSNNYNLTGRNAANTLSLPLIGRNGSDRIDIDVDGYGTTIGGGGTIVLNPTGGNVGIGTASPAYKLDVNRSSLGAIAQFITIDGTYNPRLLINGTAEGIQLFATYSSGGAEALMFGTANSEKMRLTSNLIIGSTVDSGEKLQVSGNVKVSNSGTSTIRVKGNSITGTDFQNDSAGGYIWNRDATPLYFATNGIQRLSLDGSTGAATFSSSVTASSFIKSGGTSSQYLMADGSVTTGSALIITNRRTASYTLALTDADKLVEMNVATANNLTVPLNSSVAFPIGTKIDLAQYGAGQTTVVATSGVTVRSAGGALKLTSQYSGATLVKIATDEWYLFGNITV